MMMLPRPAHGRHVHFDAVRAAFYERCENKDGTLSKRERVVPGLMSQLARLYWPHYTYEKAVHGPLDKSEKKPCIARERGQAFGKRIDEEVGRAIGILNRRKFGVARFLACFGFKNRRKAKADPDARAVVQEMTGGKTIHRYTKAVLQFLYDHGLHPVMSQLPVLCMDGNAATAIDIIAVERARKDGGGRRRLWVLELKTGFDGVYDRHTNHRMSSRPFDTEWDSVRTQHQAQVLASMCFFASTFPELMAQYEVKAGVLRACTSGVKFYPANMEVDGLVDLWRTLCGKPLDGTCDTPGPCRCVGCRLKSCLQR